MKRKDNMGKASIGLLVAWALAAWMATASAQQVTNVLSDSFTAPDFTLLNGRTMPVGGKIWGATANLDIEGGHVVQIANNPAGGDNAGIPFAVTPSTLAFSVEAQLHPDNGGNWEAIGFNSGSSTDLVAELRTDGILWALVRGDGSGYQLFQNGQNLLSQGAVAPSFVNGVLNDVKLDYSMVSGNVTLTVNGTPITTVHAPGVHYSSIGAANFELYAQLRDAAVGQVDNFTLTAVVPEPTSVVLAIGGILLVCRRHRHP